MSVVALEDDGPFIRIIILASADINSVTSVVVVITAYRFGGTCACVVVGMRAMCTGCAVKGGVYADHDGGPGPLYARALHHAGCCL